MKNIRELYTNRLLCFWCYSYRSFVLEYSYNCIKFVLSLRKRKVVARLGDSDGHVVDVHVINARDKHVDEISKTILINHLWCKTFK